MKRTIRGESARGESANTLDYKLLAPEISRKNSRNIVFNYLVEIGLFLHAGR